MFKLWISNTLMIMNIWVDNNTGFIYRGDKAMVKFLRSQGDVNYNNASDEYLINEAHTQNWITLCQ